MISARQISVRVKTKEILKNVSFELQSGEILAVIGQNGAGKSSLLKVLCGDRKPAGGEVMMNDVPLENWKADERAKIRAVLPQDSALNFPFTAAEVVLMGRAPHLVGGETAHDYEIVEAALAAFGVADLKDRIYPDAFRRRTSARSSGESCGADLGRGG